MCEGGSLPRRSCRAVRALSLVQKTLALSPARLRSDGSSATAHICISVSSTLRTTCPSRGRARLRYRCAPHQSRTIVLAGSGRRPGLVSRRSFSCRRSCGEDVGVQEVVAEFAAGVELFGQGDELGEFGVAGVELLWGHGEEFAPVGAGLKWREFFFDVGQELAYSGPVLFPG